MRREQREQLYAAAPPIQKGYRSVVAMIHMMVASCCIGVGLREEDSVCSASFGNLLVIVGFTELVQAGLCVYLVLRDIGIEGEHARTCILLIDVRYTHHPIQPHIHRITYGTIHLISRPANCWHKALSCGVTTPLSLWGLLTLECALCHRSFYGFWWRMSCSWTSAQI